MRFSLFETCLPLVVLPTVGTGFGVWRPYRLAKELPREIDEIERGSA
jgi:hypothetical protein